MPLAIAFLSLIALIIPSGFVHASDKAFFDENVSYAATRYENYLSSEWNASGKTVEDSMTRGLNSLAAGDTTSAAAAFASVVVLDKNNASAWAQLSSAYLQMKPEKPGDKYRFLETATSAAYLAYTRSKDKPAEASALTLLGEALSRRQYWRPALNAYKASLNIQDIASTRETYEKLRAERGFRLLDYTVQSDAKHPRICANFSEPLITGRHDFSKYVTVNGQDPGAVTAETRQLCISGLSHGERYQIAIRSGVPSTVGESLTKPISLTIYVRDRSPSVRFTGRNYVLPRTGQKGIPLVSVNSKTIALKVFRIGDRSITRTVLDGDFSKQLNTYRANELGQKHGQQVWQGTMPVDKVLNKEVTTAFPIDNAIPKMEAGLYVMVAEPAEKKSDSWKKRATQWFVVSDLGLTSFTGADGIHGFIRSLGSAEPLADVEIRLLARNNEILATANTDKSGHVHFAKGLTHGTGGNEPAMLVAERKGNDYAFLDLSTSSFDLTDRGVGGRNTPGALDAFIYAERGVYRPGEDVHITALLRDNNARAVPNLPLTLIYVRPDGVEQQRETVADQGAGGRTDTLTLKQTAMTGTWRAKLYADPQASPIGQTSFLVEDYVPERLELKLANSGKAYAVGERAEIDVVGRYLYGAPGSDLAMDGELTIAQNKTEIDGYAGYKFGVASEKTPPVRRPLFKLPRTDSDGKATVEAIIPRLPETNGTLRASINLRLQEPGGRAVSETVELKLKPSRPLIGVKPLFKDNHVGDNQKAAFEIIGLDNDLKPTNLSPLKWELLRVSSHFQWYSHNGSWRYEPVTYTNAVANGEMRLTAAEPVKIEANVRPGRYRLTVNSEDPDGPAAEYEFSAGWYATESADTPDVLDIALDKKTYRVGDTANITLSPRTNGKAMIAIVGDQVIATKLVDVKAGDNTVSLEVKQNWSPGAYVTATVYRPLDEKAHRMPGRAIGVKWLPLDNSDQTLTVNLDLPKKVRPNDILTVPVKLGGLEPGSKTHLVLAAVDVGILSLTNYQSPKPTSWYYGKRRLGTEIRDLYGRLIDGMQGTRGRIRSGGDGASFSTNAPPPTQKPLALYSGIVEIDSDGKAEVSFDIPAFDGTLRFMGIAWNNSQLGQVEQDIIIRDPVVITATTPRFLTAGDKSEVHVTIDNVGGEQGDYQLKLDLYGLKQASSADTTTSISLNKAQRMARAIPIEADAIGDAKISLTLSGPNGYKATRVYDLNILPAAPNLKRHFVSKLVKQGGKLTINKDAYSGLIKDSVKVAVNVSPAAALDVPGLLLSLDRYPHGCAEQITSRALPLLYLSSLAEKYGLAGDEGVKKRVQAVIDRLAEVQDSSGSFGLWSPAGEDLWLTAYITDFLTRAKEAGYKVKQRSFAQALDRLANYINYAPDFTSGGQDVAYALYVLARNSRANIGDLRYYVDTKIDNFATPLARAQLGAALSLYGDKPRSTTAFRTSIRSLKGATTTAAYRSDYGTSLRDGAAALTLISETGIERNSIPTLTNVLEKLRATKSFTTTQENAWLLLAANALLDDTKDISLNVNGTQQSTVFQKILKASDVGDKPFTVTNDGDADLSASVTIHGASLTPEPAAAKGFELTRTYFTLDGQQVDLSQVRQNDRLVAILNVKEITPKKGRLILVDRLPAGFEIENPRLVSGTDTKSLAWLGNSISPAHKSFRDDKFVAAFNLGSSGKDAKPASATLAYIIRAVVPGTYIHPAATLEDMYRPDRFAQTNGGQVVISRAQANR